jgi:multidrug transporter EmrE-like cation transporter
MTTLHKTQHAISTEIFLVGALLSFSLIGVRLDTDQLSAAYLWTLCGAVIVGYFAYVVVSVARYLREGEF